MAFSCSLAQTRDNSKATALNVSTTPCQSWIIDSDATNMTGCSKLFSPYSPCAGNQKIKLADGSLSAITGKGSIAISNKLTLQNVLHIPNLSCNSLLANLPMIWSAVLNFCQITVNSRNWRRGEWSTMLRSVGGLYYFEGGSSLIEQQLVSGFGLFTNSRDDEIMLWYRR